MEGVSAQYMVATGTIVDSTQGTVATCAGFVSRLEMLLSLSVNITE